MKDEWLLECSQRLHRPLSPFSPPDIWRPPLPQLLLSSDHAWSFWPVRLTRINLVIGLLPSMPVGTLTACERLTEPRGLLHLEEEKSSKFPEQTTRRTQFKECKRPKCVHSFNIFFPLSLTSTRHVKLFSTAGNAVMLSVFGVLLHFWSLINHTSNYRVCTLNIAPDLFQSFSRQTCLIQGCGP